MWRSRQRKTFSSFWAIAKIAGAYGGCKNDKEKFTTRRHFYEHVRAHPWKWRGLLDGYWNCAQRSWIKKKSQRFLSAPFVRVAVQLNFNVTLHETSHHLHIQPAFKFITFEHSEESCRDYLRYVTCIHLIVYGLIFHDILSFGFFSMLPRADSRSANVMMTLFYLVCCARWNIVTF